jgi:hypothetical protein
MATPEMWFLVKLVDIRAILLRLCLIASVVIAIESSSDSLKYLLGTLNFLINYAWLAWLLTTKLLSDMQAVVSPIIITTEFELLFFKTMIKLVIVFLKAYFLLAVVLTL